MSREADSAGEPRAAAEVAHVDVEAAPREPGVVVVVPVQHALGQRSLRRRELLRFLIAGRGQRLRAAGVVVLRLRQTQYADPIDSAMTSAAMRSNECSVSCRRAPTAIHAAVIVAQPDARIARDFAETR